MKSDLMNIPLPDPLVEKLVEKLDNGEPFRLEITPERFVLEQPDENAKKARLSDNAVIAKYMCEAFVMAAVVWGLVQCNS